MEDQEFNQKVALSLAGCQLVEQELKLYISEALLLAKRSIGKRMPFKMTGEDYQDSPLERLIGIFRKLTDNDILVRDLDAFKRERNFLSHAAITSCLDFEGNLQGSAATEIEPRLAAIRAESERLVYAIHEEANKFTVLLAFDESLAPERTE